MTIEATGEAKLLMLSGEPIDEPVVANGPIVLYTADEIRLAFVECQRGAFGRMEP